MEHTGNNFLTWVTKEPIWGDALLDLILTNKEELARNVEAEAVTAAMTMTWWGSGSYEEGMRQIAGLQPRTSGDQTLVSSGIC